MASRRRTRSRSAHRALIRALRLAVIVMACAAPTSQAEAQTGSVNLHLELGGGAPLAGELLDDDPFTGEPAGIPLGILGGIGFDWRVTRLVAPELRFGAGYVFGGFPASGDDHTTTVSAALGARFRLLGQGRGMQDKLWLNAHVGIHDWDGIQIGGDVGLGHEWALSEAASLGAFTRFTLMPAGNGDRVDARVVIGLAFSFEVLRAAIPRGRYGVDEVEVRGVEQMDDEALLSCLATRERPTFSINLGRTSDPECGLPPFDADRIHIALWRWPWTEWPLFDRSVWERDVDRVERWYRARGFYEARVLSLEVDPPEAIERDLAVTGGPPVEDAGEDDEDDEDAGGPCPDGCEVRVALTVEEGEPVLVADVAITGDAALPRSLREDLRDALTLEVGARFDEERYDRGLETLRIALANASYAHAVVRGRVEIDRTAHGASVRYAVDPGPPCTFGAVQVEQAEATGDGGGLCENENLVRENAETIAAAALIEEGSPFSNQAIAEAHRAIYALGAFSSVEVVARPSDERDDTVVPVTVRAVPGRLCRFGVGGGIQAGRRILLEEDESVPEWDFHLIGFAEFRNFLGGLRKLRIEERPRLIFQNSSPLTDYQTRELPGRTLSDRTGPVLGNEVRLEFREPAFFEPRTTLALSATWDLGPDPYQGFNRHDLDGRIGPERSFLDGRLFAALRFRENVLFPLDEDDPTTPDIVEAPSGYNVAFLEQVLQLDLRDDPRAPTRGALFGVGVHEAGFFLPASWDYIRVTPEARGYVPLPLGIVLAGRFALGALFIVSADADLDEDGQRFGPQRFRLRGGGATSVRGYLPGDLGDSDSGGLRRWEGSLELRFPVTADFGLVTFADVGDVHGGKSFRFDWIHLSMGLGLRYRTIVGPVRLDVGWRVPEMQVVGVDDASLDALERFEGPGTTNADIIFLTFPGAVHLTIGEAF